MKVRVNSVKRCAAWTNILRVVVTRIIFFQTYRDPLACGGQMILPPSVSVRARWACLVTAGASCLFLSVSCFVLVSTRLCLCFFSFSCPARASRKRRSMLTWISGATTTRAMCVQLSRALYCCRNRDVYSKMDQNIGQNRSLAGFCSFNHSKWWCK